MQEIILHYPAAPYYAQIEDYEHLSEYFDGKKSILTDPVWKSSGARDIKTYAHWTNRACGIVCVKTCLETFGSPIYPLHYWIQKGLHIDGYLVREDPAGNPVEIGWKHTALAALCIQEGLNACPTTADIELIETSLREGKILIASVSYEIGTDRPITKHSGHLVSLLGMELTAGNPSAIILHNPSGRSPALRDFARIPIQRFKQAFSQRVIIIEKENKTDQSRS